jgi:hypothetical protein
MRTFSVSAALFSVLVLTAPAAAQKSDMPKELWSEYPLVQKVEPPESSAIGPFLPPRPPAAPEAASPSENDSTRWAIFLGLLALGTLVLLYTERRFAPVAESGGRAVGRATRRLLRRATVPTRTRTRKPEPHQLREHPAPIVGSRAQYAPLPPVAVAEPDIEREPRRSVVRRTGLLRSRFVVVSDEPGGKVSRVARSRSFWRVGGVARRERAADDAWADLVNDLRAAGWELDSPRSDYYVLLRRIDNGTSSLLPTIEAYTLASDEPRDA